MASKEELEEALYTIINCYGKESIYDSNGYLRQKDNGDYHTDEKGNKHYMSVAIETLEKAIDRLEKEDMIKHAKENDYIERIVGIK